MAFYTKPIIMEVSRSNQWPLRTELARHILPQPASGAPRQSNQTQPGTAYGRVEHRNNPTNPRPCTAPTPQAPQNWQTSKCKTTPITGLPTAPNHNSQGPDVLSALHIHSVPRYSAWLDLAPFPAHSKPISNEFPRSQFKNTRGRLLAPMKFNSTPHSRC